MQEQSLKHISNISHSPPTKQCQRELDLILGMAGATVGQRKDILQGSIQLLPFRRNKLNITFSAMKPEDIVAFSKELLSNFYAEALVRLMPAQKTHALKAACVP